MGAGVQPRPPGPAVGFVGLGNIGLPICRRLLAGGRGVVAFDTSDAALGAAAEDGATPAARPAGVAAATQVVFTCLPTPAVVAEVVAGPDGLLQASRPGLVVVDLSTNAPQTVADLHARCLERRAHFLDSPVAGGVPAARAGSLTLMVGGDREAFGQVRPLLDHFAAHVFFLGDVGSGTVAKLVNNYLAMCNLAAAAEAFLAAKRAGIDPAELLEVLEASSGGSAILERYRRKVLPGDFSVEFAIKLAQKDLRLAMEIGARHDVPMPFALAVSATLERACALGHGDDDLAALVRVMEAEAGEEIRAPALARDR